MKGRLASSKLGDSCKPYVGSAWDPTHQCIPWSGSPHCDDGKLCGDESYEYECSYDEDRYSCAPGDLSGKIGSSPPPVGAVINEEIPGLPDLTSLIPETESLTDKVLAITCASNEDEPQFIACAPIQYDHEHICCPFEATFSGSGGINGTVAVGSGNVAVSLDVSGTPDVPNGWDVCITGGMSYHIHDKWTHDDLQEKYGSDCGGEYTVRLLWCYEL